MGDTPEQAIIGVGGKIVPIRSGTSTDGAIDTSEAQTNAALPQELQFISPYVLQCVPVPARQWIVPEWSPVGCVTLSYGDGGTGKTLLAQQLMTSAACGKPWIGLAVERCRSVGLFCEDDLDELHRRQDRINAAYGVDYSDLSDMAWASGAGQDNVLMRFQQDGKPIKLPRIEEIRTFARKHGARLIVIDTAADTFGGNENDRAQVRAYLGSLNALAMELDAAVLVNAHPSRSGMSEKGDMDGGSTGWSNSARSRWSLARPKADDEADADNDERVLTRRKANYASIGDSVKLRWRNGVLIPASSPAGLVAVSAAADADEVFLALLAKADAGNLPVSASNCAHNYAPKIFVARPDRQGFTRREFEGAMQRLMAAGKLTLVNYGRKGDERRRLAVAVGSDNA